LIISKTNFRTGKDDLIGDFFTTLSELFTKKQFELMSKKGKKAGILHFEIKCERNQTKAATYHFKPISKN
jgi:hypothetical protein